MRQDGGPNTMRQDSPSSVEGQSNYFFFLAAFFFAFLATDFHLRSVLGSNMVAKIVVWKERERLV